MNHPINPTAMQPIALAELLPISAAAEIPAGTLAPIDADIRREEAEALAARTATPLEVFYTLIQSKHDVRTVGQETFISWLTTREWPEEQSQVYTHERTGDQWIMKLFKGHDGFAVKWVPIEEGKRIRPDRAVIEVYTLVKS